MLSYHRTVQWRYKHSLLIVSPSPRIALEPWTDFQCQLWHHTRILHGPCVSASSKDLACLVDPTAEAAPGIGSPCLYLPFANSKDPAPWHGRGRHFQSRQCWPCAGEGTGSWHGGFTFSQTDIRSAKPNAEGSVRWKGGTQPVPTPSRVVWNHNKHYHVTPQSIF